MAARGGAFWDSSEEGIEEIFGAAGGVREEIKKKG